MTCFLKKHYPLIFFIILLAVVFLFSLTIRTQKLVYWEKDKSNYVACDYPAMTTLDAYYWLRYAKEYDKGIYNGGSLDKLRFFPDYKEKPKIIPMLSFILAKASVFFDNNYYYAGLYLIPFLASLFVIPLGLYFYIIKKPLAGLIGAIIATASYMYIARTTIGRVDTDALNLFFPITASLFLLLIYLNNKKGYIYLNTLLLAITLLLFNWWYAHPGFIVVYFAFLILILLIKRSNIKIFITSIIIFFIFSNPIYFIEGIYNLFHFASNYIIDKPDRSGINMPNILSTITEAQKRPINMTMSAILSNNYVNYFGLLSFILISLFFYKKIIPIIPLFLLGIISFKSSIRFVMFLAPFVGIGYGLLIHFIIEKLRIFEKYRKIYVYIGSLLFAILLTVVLTAKTSFYNYTPIPSIQPDIVKSFIDIRNKDLNDAKIVTWWDYGYAIEDITGYATFHDGGSQNTLKTYLIAKSLTSNNQKTLYNIINLLSGYKIETISELFNNKPSLKEIFENIDYNIKDNIYLLFTSDMITKYNAISQIGSFNIKTGSSQPGGFQLLNCSSFTSKQLECGQFSIDLINGLINNKIPIKNVTFITDGQIKNSFDFYNNGLFIEILIKNRSIIGVFLLEEDTYRSNFNQIYILGNYDKNHLIEVYNNFPSVRMFKIINN